MVSHGRFTGPCHIGIQDRTVLREGHRSASHPGGGPEMVQELRRAWERHRPEASGRDVRVRERGREILRDRRRMACQSCGTRRPMVADASGRALLPRKRRGEVLRGGGEAVRSVCRAGQRVLPVQPRLHVREGHRRRGLHGEGDGALRSAAKQGNKNAIAALERLEGHVT